MPGRKDFGEIARQPQNRELQRRLMKNKRKDPKFLLAQRESVVLPPDATTDPAIVTMINLCDDKGVAYKDLCEKTKLPVNFITNLKRPGDRGRGKNASIYKIRELLRALGYDLAVIAVDHSRIK